jgi:hypothetical protein
MTDGQTAWTRIWLIRTGVWRHSGSRRWTRRPDGAGTVHLVVWVPWEEAESRVAAGVAAGGRIVRHNVEEMFWTLADPAGNEVDVATTSAPN